MAAPAGNQFWKLRSKHGRDKIFASPELLYEEACRYFNWVDAHPWWKNEQLKKPYYETDEKGKKRWITVTKIATARPYTLHALCLYLHVNTLYFNQFEKSLEGKNDELSEGFSQVIRTIRDIIFTQKFEGAAVGAFNHNIIARDLGMVDKGELGFRDKNGNPTDPPKQVMIINGKEIEF